MERDLMSNFSISVYRRTRERYLDFKKENDLTHDEAINKLLDTNEENGIEGKKAKISQEGVSHD